MERSTHLWHVSSSSFLACTKHETRTQLRRYSIDYICIEPQQSENPFYQANCGTATEPSSVGMCKSERRAVPNE